MRKSHSHIPTSGIRVLLGLLVLGAVAGQQPANQRTHFLNVTVTDSKGHVVAQLSKVRFNVSENKRQYEITSFTADDSPMSIAILVDMSASITREDLKRSTDWVSDFVKMANKAHEYLIIGFDLERRILCDWDCNPRDPIAIPTAISKESKRQTALYDACDFALKQLMARPRTRRALIVLTDGLDNTSKITFSQLRRQFQQSDILFYALGTLRNVNSNSVLGMEGEGILDEFATVTGGRAFFPHGPGDLKAIAEQLSLELRHQYILGFEPETQSSHELRKLKLKLIPDTLEQGGKRVRLIARYKEAFSGP